jgi:hypothetical protein
VPPGDTGDSREINEIRENSKASIDAALLSIGNGDVPTTAGKQQMSASHIAQGSASAEVDKIGPTLVNILINEDIQLSQRSNADKPDKFTAIGTALCQLVDQSRLALEMPLTVGLVVRDDKGLVDAQSMKTNTAFVSKPIDVANITSDHHLGTSAVEPGAASHDSGTTTIRTVTAIIPESSAVKKDGKASELPIVMFSMVPPNLLRAQSIVAAASAQGSSADALAPSIKISVQVKFNPAFSKVVYENLVVMASLTEMGLSASDKVACNQNGVYSAGQKVVTWTFPSVVVATTSVLQMAALVSVAGAEGSASKLPQHVPLIVRGLNKVPILSGAAGSGEATPIFDFNVTDDRRYAKGKVIVRSKLEFRFL